MPDQFMLRLVPWIMIDSFCWMPELACSENVEGVKGLNEWVINPADIWDCRQVGVATDTARRIRAEQAMAKYQDVDKLYDNM
jgi:hypothetical protein